MSLEPSSCFPLALGGWLPYRSSPSTACGWALA